MVRWRRRLRTAAWLAIGMYVVTSYVVFPFIAGEPDPENPTDADPAWTTPVLVVAAGLLLLGVGVLLALGAAHLMGRRRTRRGGLRES
jgi:protein-S-isoprenylcysteine O-methyltransferase Ste14